MTEPAPLSGPVDSDPLEDRDQADSTAPPNPAARSDDGPPVVPPVVPEASPVDGTASRGPPASVPWERTLGEVRGEISQLRQLFQDKLLRDQNHQAVVKTLHEALTSAQNDLVWKMLRPVLLEIVRLYDDLVSAQRLYAPAPALEQLVQDAEDILYRQGFERYSCDSERLEPSLQKVRRTVPAESAADVGRVVERIRPGFRSEKYVLRPEEVAVYASAPTNRGARREGGQ